MSETATAQNPEAISIADLADSWPILSTEERLEGFRLVDRDAAEEFFTSLRALDQADLLQIMTPAEARHLLRQLAPDDAADVLQAVPPAKRAGFLDLLDESARREVTALLAYAEDDAGGLMSPRYARLRPELRVDEAIAYLRIQARERLETIYYVYVLDSEQHLLGVVSFRELFAAAPDKSVADIMQPGPRTIRPDIDPKDAQRILRNYDASSAIVTTSDGELLGIVRIAQKKSQKTHKAA